jgi:hypothetical protein
MARDKDIARNKLSGEKGTKKSKVQEIVVDERAQPEQKLSFRGYSPLLDETPGQPEFKKLRQHPRIALLMKQPGHRMVLRAKKEDDEITQKEVLVYNAKNDLCGKLVWTPAEGEQFSLIS